MNLNKDINPKKFKMYFNYTYRELYKGKEKRLLIDGYESFLNFYKCIIQNYKNSNDIKNYKELIDDINRISNILDFPDIIQNNKISINNSNSNILDITIEEKDSINKVLKESNDKDNDIEDIIITSLSLGILLFHFSFLKYILKNCNIPYYLQIIEDSKNTLTIHNKPIIFHNNNIKLIINKIIIYGSYIFHHNKNSPNLNNKNGFIIGSVIFYNIHKKFINKLISFLDKDKLLKLLTYSNYYQFIEECYNIFLMKNNNYEILIQLLTGLDKNIINRYIQKINTIKNGKELIHIIDNMFNKLIQNKEVIFTLNETYNLSIFKESYEDQSQLFRHFMKLCFNTFVRAHICLDEISFVIPEIINDYNNLIEQLKPVRFSQKLKIVKKFILN